MISTKTTSLLLTQSANLISEKSTFNIDLFSALYASTLHNNIKNKELISFCFKGAEKPVIADKDNFKIAFDKAFLKLAINFLLENCFFLNLQYLSLLLPNKSLEYLWVLTQHLLWPICFFIALK